MGSILLVFYAELFVFFFECTFQFGYSLFKGLAQILEAEDFVDFRSIHTHILPWCQPCVHITRDELFVPEVFPFASVGYLCVGHDNLDFWSAGRVPTLETRHV